MTKYLCRIISRFTLIINDKVLMFLWLSVIDKKVSHPNEIQNTFVTYRYGYGYDIQEDNKYQNYFKIIITLITLLLPD